MLQSVVVAEISSTAFNKTVFDDTAIVVTIQALEKSAIL